MPDRKPRIVAILGKFVVSDILHNPRRAKVQLGGSTTMTIDLPDIADVRVGDLLTYYTEFLVRERFDA